LATAKKRQCKTCGEAIRYTPGRGRPSVYCDTHKPKKNRARDLRARAAKGDKGAGEQLAKLGSGAVDGSLTQLQRFAAVLALGGDLETSAQLAGIEARGAALQAMEKKARKKYGKLAEGRLEGGLELIPVLLNLTLLRALDCAAQMPANMVAASLKSYVTAYTELTGGGTALYSDVEVYLAGPDEEATAEWFAQSGADPSTLEKSW
jgi:hypothetical protein